MCTKLSQVPGSVIAFYLAVGCFARRASSAGFDMRTSLRLRLCSRSSVPNSIAPGCPRALRLDCQPMSGLDNAKLD